MPPRRNQQPSTTPTRTAPKPPRKPPRAFPAPAAPVSTAVALPPLRSHAPSYHYAQLLGDRDACAPLLKWFGGVQETRCMPWRKEWVDLRAAGGRREELMTRAYEVWVSEVSKFGFGG